MFARSHHGKFIVRVEDTDQERVVPGAVDGILDGLEWLGIDWDEGPRVGGDFGPYYQSQRLHHYHAAAERLIEKGHAYRCYCTRERLAELREEQQRNKQSIGYSGHCRSLTAQQRANFEAEAAPSVVRFMMPAQGTTEVNDLIRGEVEWQNDLLDDFVLIKSDKFPTYHLAVVVDDNLMEISHVLRAEEWLPSTPRHLLLYQALELPPPQFGHLPMILGPDRAKLSKRHGATSILEYQSDGYLPDALRNFMMLLGWSLDDHTDTMDLDVMLENFSLERVGKPAAIFDIERLQWMNGLYLRQFSPQELADQMLPFLQRDLPPELLPIDRQYLMNIVPLVQERLKTLADSADMTAYFFESELTYDAASLVQRGMDHESTVNALRRAQQELSKPQPFNSEDLEQSLRAVGEELGLRPREFFGLIRTTVTGRSATPPLFEVMAVLGQERVLHRVDRAIEKLAAL